MLECGNNGVNVGVKTGQCGGLGAGRLSHLWQYFRSSERRSGEGARGVTDTIRAVTGSRAQTLKDFFRANAGEFGSSRHRML